MRYLLSTALFLLMSNTAFGQQHVPTLEIPAGTFEIIFDAQFVEIVPRPTFVINGVVFNESDAVGLYASTAGEGEPDLSRRLTALVEPDVTYDIQMLGFPEDPLAPNRLIEITTVMVATPIPTFEEQIQAALDDFSGGLDILKQLVPDLATLADALNTPAQ